MSDKPIAVGDIVMIVRPSQCGCPSKHIGRVFKVARIYLTYSVNRKCGQCRKSLPHSLCAEDADGKHRAQLFRLIKIDPPALPESIETREEIPA